MLHQRVLEALTAELGSSGGETQLALTEALQTAQSGRHAFVVADDLHRFALVLRKKGVDYGNAGNSERQRGFEVAAEVVADLAIL